MIVGQGQFSYELAEGWEQIPARWRHGDVVNVATDSRDRVYVFNRSEHPVIIYDRTGKFVTSWGEQVFTRPHGITIHNDVVYCADDTDHTVRAHSLDGTLLWTLGWRLTTGLEFRWKYGLDYGVLMRHEHVNTAAEIEAVLRAFFKSVRRSVFGIAPALSFYQCFECTSPFH